MIDMQTGTAPPVADMLKPVSCYTNLAGRESHYLAWGNPDNPPVIMWHGLARTGRDFDTAAAALCDDYYVICPDTLGRGLSAWARDPEREYTLEFYCEQAVSLLDGMGFDTVRWVGTSMGGAMGILLAGGPAKNRLSHLLLNDIGPELDATAVARLKSYVTDPPVVPRLTDLEHLLRTIYAPFGTLTDQEWRSLTEHSARRTRDGQFTLHYDPRVMHIFAADVDRFRLWQPYDAVDCKTLLFVGEHTDLLTPQIIGNMRARGPKPAVETIAGCGHAPYLNTAHQLDLMRRFLAS